MTRAPMSKLARYFIHNQDPKIRRLFMDQIHLIHENNYTFYQIPQSRKNKDKSLEFYSTSNSLDTSSLNLKTDIGVSANFVKIDPTKDAEGNKIKEGHPLFELSDIILNFKNGEKTILSNTKTKNINLEDYFTKRGKHFCAGYLSRFGKVVYNDDSFAKIIYRKIVEDKAYKAALKFWQNN